MTGGDLEGLLDDGLKIWESKCLKVNVEKVLLACPPLPNSVWRVRHSACQRDPAGTLHIDEYLELLELLFGCEVLP